MLNMCETEMSCTDIDHFVRQCFTDLDLNSDGKITEGKENLSFFFLIL
jgi:hypothetical protein